MGKRVFRASLAVPSQLIQTAKGAKAVLFVETTNESVNPVKLALVESPESRDRLIGLGKRSPHVRRKPATIMSPPEALF